MKEADYDVPQGLNIVKSGTLNLLSGDCLEGLKLKNGMLFDQMTQRLLRAILACIIVVATFSVGAQARLLTGVIEHSDTLEPLDQSLTPGEVFDPDKLPNADSEGANNWYRIPDWLAGTWHKDSQTDYYRYTYANNLVDTTTRTEIARADGTWGTQIDQKGEIWQFDPAPFNATVDGGDTFIVQLVRSSIPVEVSEAKFVRRSIDTQMRVSKATGQIEMVESGEQITTYTPEGQDLIKRETSAKVFDTRGQPILLGKSFAYEKRIAVFVPQNMYKGRDMKLLFKQFMEKQSETASARSESQP
jgi:hypothetical protein